MIEVGGGLFDGVAPSSQTGPQPDTHVSSKTDHPMNSSDQREFEDLHEQRQPSFLEEFLAFIVQNKKWWLIPIIVVLGLFGLLVMLSSTGAAPFIYTLF